MCRGGAAALPRSLIGDALLVHGLRVEDILTGTRTQGHKLTPFAQVNGLTLTYPPEAPPLPSAVILGETPSP